MNQIATAPAPVSPATMEHVLGTGDLSKLTIPQRVSYYTQVCQTIGLNPLTQPFRFLAFQGQIKLYATRDCCDQLRSLRKIDLAVTDKRIEEDMFIVTVQARTADGRKDEDIGAVALGLMKGEARANQIMKAVTKAKRRTTLSICGLGFLDEAEVETLPGAKTFAAEEPLPPVPIRRAAITRQAVTDEGEAPRTDPPVAFIDHAAAELENEGNGTKWLAMLTNFAGQVETMDDLAALRDLPSVRTAEQKAPSAIKGMITDIWRGAVDRLAPQPAEAAAGEPIWEEPTAEPQEPPDEDEAVIARVEAEVASLKNAADIAAWSRGPIRPVMAALRVRNPDAYTRAITIIDDRSRSFD